jgi:ATPase subunit of ABC transporter with duplicated ATPase domains
MEVHFSPDLQARINRLISETGYAADKLVEALASFEGTMIFVSHDRTFLRGLGSRVLELQGGDGADRAPHIYPGSYVEYVQASGHEAPGIHS